MQVAFHRCLPVTAVGGNRARSVSGAGHHPHRSHTRHRDRDRGYGEATVEDDLATMGVRTVVIPRKGKPGLARQQLETPSLP